jgi:carbonic anhydrase
MNGINGWIGRRNLLTWMVGGAGITAAAALGYSQPAQADPSSSPVSVSPDTALKRLLDGNQRFIRQGLQHPNQSSVRLQEIAQAQHPFAVILSCADSRVPPEIVFDQGLGNLFDVRVAGNVVTPETLGSLEYAAILLETPLLMVLGHERCGAVTAAVQGEPLPGKIEAFITPIKPAVARVKSNSGDRVENAVIANVQYQIEQLQQQSPLLNRQVEAGKLKIVGGRYDLDTGQVTIVS